MPRTFTRERIDLGREQKMITMLITSTQACEDILPNLTGKENMVLQTPYLYRVLKWVQEYWRQYKQAPGEYIREIFETQKRSLPEEESSLIEDYLSQLSEEYERGDFSNTQYLIDQSNQYVEERMLVYISQKTSELIKVGRLEEAKNLVTGYRSFAKVTSKWLSVLDPQVASKIVTRDDNELFTFPGAFGELVGPLERGFFFAILGPIKRGKTWMLLEIASLALMSRLKVVFISLEMDARRMLIRFYKRLTSTIGKYGMYKYPCFDCRKNQEGTCSREERTNTIKLVESDGDGHLVKPEYNPNLHYRPCTYCRDNNLDDYEPETWFTTIERPAFNLDLVRKKVATFGMAFGEDNLRFISYPRFSAGIEEIERDLAFLEMTEGFIPDVILVDYIDILKKPPGEFRHTVDELWMHHARLATERYCLVGTATQARRDSWRAAQIEADDTSENYRNPAHVDLMIALNQTKEQKKAGVMKVNVIAKRDGDFNENDKVMLLQNLSAGQPNIDSEWE